MDVLSILRPCLHKLQLKDFEDGFLNENRDRLFAYTLLPVDDEDYENLYNWFLHDKGFSYEILGDEWKYINYNDDGSYSVKGAEQLVKEGIMKFASLRFYGALHEGEWFVMEEVSYFEQTSIAAAKAVIEAQYSPSALFSASVYQPLPESTRELHFGALRQQIAKKLGRPVDLCNSAIRDHVRDLPPEAIPFTDAPQPVEWREYIRQPWLVGYLKQQEKSRINRAFETYLNEAVFLPLVKKLKIHWPAEFAETHGLYSDHYPLIYPQAKDYVLCIVKAMNEVGESRLHYFLYIAASGQLFRWTKPQVKAVPGHHAEWILEDIRDLSCWRDEYSFHEPSVTMDDPVFWKEHVLKKNDGRYIYLVPIDFQ